MVRGHNGTDHLYLIHKAVFKKRPDGSVDQPRGQRLFFARPSFSLKKTAWYFTDRVPLLDVMHAQREKCLPGLCLWVGYHRTQNTRTAHRYQNRTGCLSRNTTCFQRDLMVTVLESFFHYIHLFSPNMTGLATRQPRFILSVVDPTA